MFRPMKLLVRQAELDLHFTDLRAPVSGRIGDRRVSPGNLVTGGSLSSTTTLLATIVSNDPIRFEFTFDEASYLRYERVASAQCKGGTEGRHRRARRRSTVVRLKLIDEPDFAHVGRMDFIDNVIESVDRHYSRPRGSSAIIDRNLHAGHVCARPGAGVRRLTTALLIPDVAIGTEQVRKFVYVVRSRQHGLAEISSSSAS